jgi:hypothetical protein
MQIRLCGPDCKGLSEFADEAASDSALVCSIALQHGTPVSVLGKAQPIDPPIMEENERTQYCDQSDTWLAFHRLYPLSLRDRQFVETLTAWRGPVSIKQRKWLAGICGMLAEAAA